MPTTKRSSAGLAAIVPTALGLAVLLAIALATPAAAQGFGWFGNLFGGFPKPQPAAPSYPGYDGDAPRQPSDRYYSRPRRRVVRRAVEPVQREAARVPAKNAALFVAVFGDSLGQMLGQGLDEALADRPDVAVLQKSRGATGLVAESYDWPKAIAELIGRPGDKLESKPGTGKALDSKAGESKPGESKAGESKASESKPEQKAGKAEAAKAGREKVDVAVMMIGINDHQPLTVDGHVLQPGTAEWTAAYAKRVLLIDEAFRARGIPLIWVGVPITKDDGFADAMAGLNDVYREAAAKTGATYVDTWEAFSDDNGNFAAYGPDVNGQTVRLRAADGIHFTKAGARKLAHFVEVHVRHALEGKAPLPLLPIESADGKEKPAKQLAAVHPDVGPIRNLNELPATANGTLAVLDASPAAERGDGRADPPPGASGSVGEPPRPGSSAAAAGDAIPLGRADNARWPIDARVEP